MFIPLLTNFDDVPQYILKVIRNLFKIGCSSDRYRCKDIKKKSKETLKILVKFQMMK